MPRESLQKTWHHAEIQRLLNELLLAEVKDPRLAAARVSAVEVSGDLGLATVFFSTLGLDDDPPPIKEAFEKARGFFRSRVASSLQLRRAPDLRFRHDTSAKRAVELGQLIDDARGTSTTRTDVAGAGRPTTEQRRPRPAVARQAVRPIVESRAATRQAAIRGGQSRSCRQPGSARDGHAAGLLRRRHAARRLHARSSQDLSRDGEARSGDDDRRRRRRDDRGSVERAGAGDRRHCRRRRPVRRRDRPGAADVLGAQARRRAAVPARPFAASRSSAARAACGSRSSRSSVTPGPISSSRPLLEGDLRPDARRGHRARRRDGRPRRALCAASA